jgi:hypothetical protein
MPSRRKLYFDVVLTVGGPSARVSPMLDADRDGETFEALPALTGDADERQREGQELTPLFVPYHWTAPTPPPAPFGLESQTPGESNPAGFLGPLVITLTGPPDPGTVTLGVTVIEAFNIGPLTGISLEVVGNTILVHNTMGGGDEWTISSGLSLELQATILELGTGDPLIANTVTWFFGP